MGLDGGQPFQITSGLADEVHPSWSPDGSSFVFVVFADGDNELAIVNTQNGDIERKIFDVVFGHAFGRAAIIGYALTALVILGALSAPGLILALLVIAVALAHGDRAYAGAGIVF